MLSTAALETALDLWADIDQHAVAAKSARLFDILAAAGDALGLDCVSLRDPAQRGSHISFRHPHAHAITQALIAHGVIGDFRDPDILRLGLTPLYLSHEDVWRAGDILREIIIDQSWKDPRFATRLAVT
jgi:kynureninase